MDADLTVKILLIVEMTPNICWIYSSCLFNLDSDRRIWHSCYLKTFQLEINCLH